MQQADFCLLHFFVITFCGLRVMGESLKEKVAIVTGAGRGVGRAISFSLAQEGADVVLASRSEDKLRETAEKIKVSGGRAKVVTTDMSDEQQIKKLVEVTEKRFGRLDILVNNAGVTHSALIEQTTTNQWDRLFRVNARGPFILCREALSLLKKASSSYIVNIISIVGIKCYAYQGAYTASKHALRGLTKVLAEELRDTNIRVHSICPGGIDTEMFRQLGRDIKKEELMQPEEIAELVLYLVTHRGNAVINELRVRRKASPPWF